jgi:phosphatidylethanolamine-binding protein (PEBP) family uncharacterized protein
MNLTVTSTGVRQRRRHSCALHLRRKAVSLPLACSGVLAGTKSYALIADDPDAPNPSAPKMICVLYNVPPSASGLPGAVKAAVI